MTPKYLIKQRTAEAGRHNPYRPRQLRYGKWVTVATADTFPEAQAAVRRLQGLYDRGIFYMGKRITRDDRPIVPGGYE